MSAGGVAESILAGGRLGVVADGIHRGVGIESGIAIFVEEEVRSPPNHENKSKNEKYAAP